MFKVRWAPNNECFLLEAILLPDKIAICKCAAHTTNKDFVSTGNARADAAAKDAAAKQSKHTVGLKIVFKCLF